MEEGGLDGKRSGFQSITRAAGMLGLFTVDEPELSLAELTRRLDVKKPTAHRYATALRKAGLLRASEGGYTLGPRIVELASIALAGLGVIKVAQPHLERLTLETSQTAVLSVWDGEAPVVVRVHDNASRMVRIVVSVGSRLPLDSAQGVVFRAFGKGADGAGIEQSLELERARRLRIAYFANVVDGIAAIAAPVFQGQEIVATIALVGTTSAIGANATGEMSRTLRVAADRLSSELGYVSDDVRVA
jgi:DNA-binding IclR family transcriptional regulator